MQIWVNRILRKWERKAGTTSKKCLLKITALCTGCLLQTVLLLDCVTSSNRNILIEQSLKYSNRAIRSFQLKFCYLLSSIGTCPMCRIISTTQLVQDQHAVLIVPVRSLGCYLLGVHSTCNCTV